VSVSWALWQESFEYWQVIDTHTRAHDIYTGAISIRYILGDTIAGGTVTFKLDSSENT